jgi:hypothetical protein
VQQAHQYIEVHIEESVALRFSLSRCFSSKAMPDLVKAIAILVENEIRMTDIYRQPAPAL